MKTKTKALVLALCAVLLVVTTVFATMAYLTSTDKVTNTFTVGNVKITLDEAKVDLYGVKDGTERVQANTYKLIPGHEYTKDPTIHVDANSEDCYLFVKLENGLKDIISDTTIEAQMNSNGWVKLSTYARDEAVDDDIWVYIGGDGIAKAGENPVLFEKFKISGTKEDLSSYENKKIVITAYAVQADGFNKNDVMTRGYDQFDAWQATFGNTASETTVAP